MSYEPFDPPVSESWEELRTYLIEEYRRVAIEFRLIELLEYHVEPEKPFHLQRVLADGSDWDPGWGRGVYYYDENSTSWIPMFTKEDYTFPTISLSTGWNIDCSLGTDFHKGEIDGSGSFTISNLTSDTSRSFYFEIRFLYTSGTITWFSGYTKNWPNGAEPTWEAGHEYIVGFEIKGGSTEFDIKGVVDFG